MGEPSDSIFSGANGAFIAELYERFLENPASVDESWSDYFAELAADGDTAASDYSGASWARSRTSVVGVANGEDHAAADKTGKGAPVSAEEVRAAAYDSIRARILIRSFRVRGHLAASFDPLGLVGAGYHKDLDYKTYGFTEGDLDRPIFIDNLAGHDTLSLRQILDIVQTAYCDTMGVEYMHIQEIEERAWIQERVEGIDFESDITPEIKKDIYRQLVEAEGFETYLQVKHTGTKRFGLDGGESMIPSVEGILHIASRLGIEEVVIGMPHRGRLNVLARTMGKPYVAIFSEFQGTFSHPDDVQGSGDVKYHLGASADRAFGDKTMHLSLTANPSHLEAVDPVVLGKVRSKQTLRNDEAREKIMGLLMHGDAAFAGQGLVPESLALSQLRGYRTGGTIHVIVNNQIGFTTNPSSSRSTPYPTDIAKGLQAPIFHVNGDDPEAVVRVSRWAMEFRQKFKRDVVIDMFCYRRHGHNEGDEPMFTQPRMYKAIAKHPTTRTIYREKLVANGTLTEAEADAIEGDFRKHLDDQFEAATGYKPNKADWLEGVWDGFDHLKGDEEYNDYDTAVSADLLKEIGLSLARVPDGINVNRKIIRQLEARRTMVEAGTDIDWATGEALAFGSLLMEGTRVRLSGQDSGRGTFSHRHAALVDQENEARYYPLSEISKEQAAFEVMDSPLSEFAVLGYEYGYSLADPNTLVLWEAQFGDFANTAQVMFDQFISSGESKWLRMSGLVVLLPHGYEGQGPEHSSARLERFLQLCAEENMQVVNCTTPANFFHALRRQVRCNYRKPLVVMSPKSLLRHRLVTSPMADFAPGGYFRRVIDEVDPLVVNDKVKRVILCSGKIYYDLLEARRERKIKDVAIIRVEQLYPWPRDAITRWITQYPNADVVWCQEEPANMGAWTFVLRRIEYILEDAKNMKAKRPLYVGRASSASTATGSLRVHNLEQEQIIDQALSWPADKLSQPFRRITDDDAAAPKSTKRRAAAKKAAPSKTRATPAKAKAKSPKSAPKPAAKKKAAAAKSSKRPATTKATSAKGRQRKS
ncbi:MAG: 2-oxoglutarate dehydrogenase E1 component [Proteobacteria bacterium]|nr:2-oxoglutarate dehydrogenase E1 component [Pseudomonadota bacterium]